MEFFLNFPHFDFHDLLILSFQEKLLSHFLFVIFFISFKLILNTFELFQFLGINIFIFLFFVSDCSFNISLFLMEEFGFAIVSLGANLMKFVQLQFVIGVMIVVLGPMLVFLSFSHFLILFVEFLLKYIITYSIIFCFNLIMQTPSDFDTQFNQAFDALGQKLQKEYGRSFEAYKKHIIPFETKRMKENQNLSFKNTSLERDKLQLLRKIEQLTSENQKNQYVMEKQTKKINDLERMVNELQEINNDNLSMIEALRMANTEREEANNEKDKLIKQIEEDKNQVLKDYHQKNDEYNCLLANYMKDKNSIAEKLNYMNEIEQTLLEKDRTIKEQQFYLKKQWEEFEEAKKKMNTPQGSVIPNRIFNKKSPSVNEEQHDMESKKEDQMSIRHQILRTPVKKIFKHHHNEIYDVEFNYNGSLMATCGGDRLIKIYDVLNFKSGVTINSNSAESIFISVSLDYSGERLLAGSTDRSVQIFSTSTGKQLNSFVGHGYKINSVSWSSSKEKCVSGSEDKQIKVWEIEKAANLLSIPCGKPVKFVHCNTVQPIVYSGHSDGSVRLYSISQGNTPIAQIKGIIDYPINSISLLSSRHQLLVSSQQGTVIHLLDLKMNKSIAKFEHKDFFNTSVQADISPSQHFVVGGNCDGYLYYWNRDKKELQKKVSGHECPITCLKYHFISSILSSCDKDGNVILWQ